MSADLITLAAPADDMIRRQALLGVRRTLLALMAPEAARYNLTAAQVAGALCRGAVSPDFRRRFEDFMRTVGIPRAEVLALARQVIEGGREEWSIEDMRILVDVYADHGTLTLGQANELATIAKWVAMTAKRRERSQPTMDALKKQLLKKAEE
jgi:hypothetical protein